MANCKWKKFINILIIVGIIILGLIILASLILLILSFCGICNFLEVSASVFIASISSLLTVLALALTVKSNNKMIELKVAEKESKSISSINLIRNSLYLETIEIDRSLQPKEITNLNPHAQKGNNNLRIGLIFSAININELSKISLKSCGLYFKHKLPNSEQLKLVLKESTEFNDIEIKGEHTFLYEIITNIDSKNYQYMLRAFEKSQDCGIIIDLCLVLKCNDDMVSIWERRKRNRINFQLVEFDAQKQRYYFSNTTKTY